MSEHLSDTNVGNIEYIRRENVINKLKNANGILYWNDTLQNSLTQLIEDSPSADVLPYSISNDGTLTITVPKGTTVNRVLVQEDGTQWGGLFYAD